MLWESQVENREERGDIPLFFGGLSVEVFEKTTAIPRIISEWSGEEEEEEERRKRKEKRKKDGSQREEEEERRIWTFVERNELNSRVSRNCLCRRGFVESIEINFSERALRLTLEEGFALESIEG